MSDLNAVAEGAAALIAELSAATPRDRLFTIALSGGSTPRRLFELLAAPPWRDQIDWRRWSVFWGDERLVPLNHPDSNYLVAEQLLLNRVPIPRAQIRPVLSRSSGDPDTVARAYAAELRGAFGDPPGKWPVFDVILLGMGSDGHTASLFPNKPSLHEQTRWVVASPPGVLPPPVPRVTFTLPVLNAARTVLFLVAGRDKAAALAEVLAGSDQPPAGRGPRRGQRALGRGRSRAQRMTRARAAVGWLSAAAAAPGREDVTRS